MEIQPAQASDVPEMVDLIENLRAQRETWQPTMWRRAANSRQASLDWFPHLIADENTIALVRSHPERGMAGFLIAFPQPSPPVYDPGLTYMIDDFCVAEDIAWPTVGRALLEQSLILIKRKGTAQCLAVSARQETGKNELLQDMGLGGASQWWTSTL